MCVWEEQLFPISKRDVYKYYETSVIRKISNDIGRILHLFSKNWLYTRAIHDMNATFAAEEEIEEDELQDRASVSLA